MAQEERLFEQFPPVITAEWMEKISADLKGADFAKKMIWKTNEGFDIMPFYRSENLEGINHLATVPGQFPFVRGAKTDNRWFVRQNIEVTDYAEANRLALDILMKGVDSLGFIITDPETINEKNFTILFEGIHAGSIEINFSTAGRALELVQLLQKVLPSKGADLKEIRGSVEANPLGRLMVNGKLCVSVDDAMEYVAGLVRESTGMPFMRVLIVNGADFNNAGADVVRELAFTLSLGNEYLAQLTDRGIPIDTAASKTGFKFATGSNYFIEIAKLRAARLLWAAIVKAYSPKEESSCRMQILSVTSEWNKTIYDPYVNMLRSQTEAMSATLGGADSLVVEPFDSAFAIPGDFSMRIARNQQLLLKEEAHFDKVADPGAGSYYIENLTAMIAGAAWKLFVETEERGGFLKSLMEGFIQSEVEKIALKRVTDVARRKEILLGTNQYPNFREKSPGNIDSEKAFGKPADDACSVKPLRLFRGAEEFEKLRLATDRAERKPCVFLLPMGQPSMRMARAQFSANFFGCAGYRIVDNTGFSSIEDGVRAAMEAKADIVVLCSSDEEYATLAPRHLISWVARQYLLWPATPNVRRI
jgi:methylmalonyl-CoA mutase